MKMPLFIAGAFLMFSATSQAAPHGGGGFRSGFAAHGGGAASRMGTGFGRHAAFRAGFGFDHNRRFFQRGHRFFVQQSVWPAYWFPYDYFPYDSPIWITGRMTTINIGTIRPLPCSRNPPEPPAGLWWSSTPAVTPGPWIHAPILLTSTAATQSVHQDNEI